MARYERTGSDTKAIEEWLKNKDNTVTICPPGAKSDPSEVGYTWGRKKKKAVEPKAEKPILKHDDD
jgi:hypothetical protein